MVFLDSQPQNTALGEGTKARVKLAMHNIGPKVGVEQHTPVLGRYRIQNTTGILLVLEPCRGRKGPVKS